MNLKTQALLTVLVVLAFVGIAQPALASTSGGSGFGRWVLLESGDIDCNMSVPQTITNETAYTFRGNVVNSDTSATTCYMTITVNGTAAYSGATACEGNNTTTRMTVTFPADTLSQGDGQWINVSLLVGDNVTVDDYWNSTINITTNIEFMVAYMIYIVTVMVTLVVIVMVVAWLAKALGRGMKS